MNRFTLLMLLMPGTLWAMNDGNDRGPVRRHGLDIANPNVQNTVHSIGNVCMNFTNYGFYGNSGSFEQSSMTNPCPAQDWAPQMEFPCGSNVQYLYHSGIWIGATIVDDTSALPRVSVGIDGWITLNELYPCEGEACNIVRRSNIPGAMDCFGNLIYDPAARAHEEYVAVYSDTLHDDFWLDRDPFDGAHRPLGIEVQQTTMQWGTPQLGDFIIAEYVIRNIGNQVLEDLTVGFYVDGDVGPAPPDAPIGQHEDDITGFLSVDSLSGNTLNIAWIADNDGRNVGVLPPGPIVAPAVMGLCALGSNQDSLVTAYNWWMSNGDLQRDGGPHWDDALENGGTPMGDVRKNRMLSNNEQDYDQIYAADSDYQNSHPQSRFDPCTGLTTEHIWSECAIQNCQDVANGYDTRFLLSFGRFGNFSFDDSLGQCVYSLNPGDRDTLTMVWAIGPDFHNASHPQPDPNQIDPTLFDFTGLLQSVRRAKLIYDSHFEFQPPGAPTIFRASGSLPNAVPLIWNQSQVGDIDIYRIFGILEDGSRELMATNGAGDTTRTVPGFINGDTLRFGLEAMDDSGFTSNLVFTDVIVGAPLPVTGVVATAIGTTITLVWDDPADPELTRYQIHRYSSDGPSANFVTTDEFLVNENLVTGRIYNYVVRAENVRNLISFPSTTVSAVPFAPQQRILIIDETMTASHGEQVVWGAYSDSLVDAMYERILTGLNLDYDIVHQNSETVLSYSLENLGQYDLVIWHAEDVMFRGSHAMFVNREELFSTYIGLGGKLVREGRRLLHSKWHMEGRAGTYWQPALHIPAAMDSFWAAERGRSIRSIQLTGAQSSAAGFPSFDLDVAKVESLRWNQNRYDYYPEGEVVWPEDSTQILYRALVTDDDSSGHRNQPVAVADSDYIVCFFPLYLLHEEDAAVILNSSIRTLRGQPLAVDNEHQAAPINDAALLPNYPNPFNPLTMIEYEVRSERRVTLNIFDLMGRKVETLVDDMRAVGRHRVQWNGDHVASGIYFVRLMAGNVVETRKIVLLK